MSKRTLQGKSYLILKCRAEAMPLRANSVALVLATPPYLDAPGVRQREWPTGDRRRYDASLASVVKEAGRILRPGGHLLLHTDECPVRRARGASRVAFSVLRKAGKSSGRSPRRVGREVFTTRYTRVQGIHWVALGVGLYRELIARYSQPGDLIADVFSGAGNAALAALLLSRRPVLLDLHHHRKVQQRLDAALRRIAPQKSLRNCSLRQRRG